jgi:hypothetical protein
VDVSFRVQPIDLQRLSASWAPSQRYPIQMSFTNNMIEGAPVLPPARAAKSSQDIFTAIQNVLQPLDPVFGVAGEVATRLWLVNHFLSSLLPSYIDIQVEGLCREISHDLDLLDEALNATRSSSHLSGFVNIPSPSGPSMESQLLTRPERMSDALCALRSSCEALIDALKQRDADAGILEPASRHMEPGDACEIQTDGFVVPLRSATNCATPGHKRNGTTEKLQRMHHSTRLCLHEDDKSPNSLSSNVRLLISALDMAFWQEFRLQM